MRSCTCMSAAQGPDDRRRVAFGRGECAETGHAHVNASRWPSSVQKQSAATGAVAAPSHRYYVVPDVYQERLLALR